MLTSIELYRRLRLALFPPVCLLCGAAGDKRRDLCAGCRSDLAANTIACCRCAEPLPLLHRSVYYDLICGRCQRQPPAFTATRAPLLYQPPLDRLIHDLKFNNQLTVGPLLAAVLGDYIVTVEEQRPKGLIPVPLHPRRLRQRGYNQALEIARPLGQRLGITVLAGAVQRVSYGTPQSDLDTFDERRRNVKNAFAVTATALPSHLAIIDDVVTTGSTVNALAHALRRAGVARVEVWACARTPKISETVL